MRYAPEKPPVFTLTSGPAALLNSGTATTFTLRFAPATAGFKTAAIHIASNDADENPFDIILTGRGVSAGAGLDTDGDGVANDVETNLVSLGFDPQVNNSALIALLRDNSLGLGLYLPSDTQAVALGSPLLELNAVSGQFTLRVGMETSADLLNWSPLPGMVDFLITPSNPATQFLRVLGKKP